ncbi:hypothetical protein Tco_0369915 [Tanacetum coccineum]
MSEEHNTHAGETHAPPHKVLTNDDILTEVLLRLPILCIPQFTCVSKQWLTVLTSLDFTLKRNQICNLDPPDYAHDDCAGLRLAFDPIKSPYYKVVHTGSNSSEIVIQIYYSETSNWSLCRERHTNPLRLATWKKLFRVLWQYVSNDNNHTNTSHVALEGKLFESRGCLLLVRRDYIGSSEFTIYKMKKGCPVWSIKYLVDTDDFMSPLPE